jgi:hypothetical protein
MSKELQSIAIVKVMFVFICSVTLSSCSWFTELLNTHRPPLTSIDQQYLSVESNLAQIDAIDPSVAVYMSSEVLGKNLSFIVGGAIEREDAENANIVVRAATTDISLDKQAINLSTDFHLFFAEERIAVKGNLLGLVGVSNQGDAVVLRAAFSEFNISSVHSTGEFSDAQEVLLRLAASAIGRYIDNVNGVLLRHPSVIALKWETSINSPFVSAGVTPATTVSRVEATTFRRYEQGVMLIERDGLTFLMQLSSENEAPTVEIELDPSPIGNQYSASDLNRIYDTYSKKYRAKWSKYFDEVPENVLFSIMLTKSSVASVLEEALNQKVAITHNFTYPSSSAGGSIELESNKMDCQDLREPFQRTRYRRNRCDHGCTKCTDLPFGGEICADEPGCAVGEMACNVREEAMVAADNAVHETARIRHQAEQEGRVAGCDLAREAADFMALAKFKTKVSGNGKATLKISKVAVDSDLSRIDIALNVKANAANDVQVNIQPIDLGLFFFCVAPYSGSFSNTVNVYTGDVSQSVTILPEKRSKELELRFRLKEIPYKPQAVCGVRRLPYPR